MVLVRTQISIDDLCSYRYLYGFGLSPLLGMMHRYEWSMTVMETCLFTQCTLCNACRGMPAQCLLEPAHAFATAVPPVSNNPSILPEIGFV